MATSHERTGWGINPAELDENPRRCPKCEAPILPGRALCHPVTSEPSNNAAPSRRELG